MARTQPFDEHFEEYEDWFESNYYAYQSELRAISCLTPRQGKGMEIGIGSGRFAVPLEIDLGVEPSESMRNLARQRGLQVLDGVAERLPFKNKRFDFALMVTTICFVDNLTQSFREAHRVLRNEGLFIIGFVDKSSALGKQYQNRKSESLFYGEATFYSAKQVSLHLAKSGFQIQSIIQTIFGTLSEVKSVQGFKTGEGEGGFVVIQAKKSHSKDSL